MELSLFIDFGSTYTKIVAIDLTKEEVKAVVQSPSTAETNIMDGLKNALMKLKTKIGAKRLSLKHKLACSSAKGGLRMVVIGFVSTVSAEAGKRAALGAGAKVVKTYSWYLSDKEIKELEALAPDIILLTGGTEGGNTNIIVSNAKKLADSNLDIPIIMAGNSKAREEIADIFKSRGKECKIADNVLPELGRLKVDSTQAIIRKIFMKKIVEAKGVDKAKSFVDEILMPTPLAVLNAARLLAEGEGEEKGMGELIMVDIGGATTDIHSISQDPPSKDFDYLPEPYAKRTVEGDLGLRINATSILDLVEERGISLNTSSSNPGLREKARYLSTHIDFIPRRKEDFSIDRDLAKVAVEIAMERHAGRIEEVFIPGKYGIPKRRLGKDLTKIESVIGTGGIFAYGKEARNILEGVLFKAERGDSLRPLNPSFYVDEKYVLFAIGLLGSLYPEKALRIIKKNLKKI